MTTFWPHRRPLDPRSERLTDALLNEMRDKNWKVRNEALQKLTAILNDAKFITPHIGALPDALVARLTDANKNLVGAAATWRRPPASPSRRRSGFCPGFFSSPVFVFCRGIFRFAGRRFLSRNFPICRSSFFVEEFSDLPVVVFCRGIFRFAGRRFLSRNFPNCRPSFFLRGNFLRCSVEIMV